jgi:hypothetical protein
MISARVAPFGAVSPSRLLHSAFLLVRSALRLPAAFLAWVAFSAGFDFLVAARLTFGFEASTVRRSVPIQMCCSFFRFS